jgi:hypothetical protein
MGRHQSGIASIPCLYASESNSRSESFEIEAKQDGRAAA